MDNELTTAKKLLLKSHLNNKQNTKILCKLGDCCSKLKEYDMAKQCYQRCINYDAYYFQNENPKYFMRLAHIYQIYLDPLECKNDAEQLNESKKLYHKALKLILNDENASHKRIQKCYFNYSQLLTKLKQYNLAKEYYQKLLLFQKLNNINTHHSVHYYYAQILYILNADKGIICYHYEKAIDLKPDMDKYYYKYSKILSALGDKIKSKNILKSHLSLNLWRYESKAKTFMRKININKNYANRMDDFMGSSKDPCSVKKVGQADAANFVRNKKQIIANDVDPTLFGVDSSNQFGSAITQLRTDCDSVRKVGCLECVHNSGMCG